MKVAVVKWKLRTHLRLFFRFRFIYDLLFDKNDQYLNHPIQMKAQTTHQDNGE